MDITREHLIARLYRRQVRVPTIRRPPGEHHPYQDTILHWMAVSLSLRSGPAIAYQVHMESRYTLAYTVVNVAVDLRPQLYR